MWKSFTAILFIILFGMTATAGPVSLAEPRNITRYVKQHTVLDEGVALGCLQYCRGNQRRGWLDYVNLERGTGQLYRFSAGAKLQNRQVTRHGTQRAVAFDYLVTVHATGTLDPASCTARIQHVWVENDRLGLSQLARRAVGRTEQVPNCRDFIVAAGFTP